MQAPLVDRKLPTAREWTACRALSTSCARNSVRTAIHSISVLRLRDVVDEAQKQAASYAAQTQELFDRYAEDERLKQGTVSEMSVDLMTAPARDEERQCLDERFRELDEERKKFTEAAVRLGREKAALEVGRLHNSGLVDVDCSQAERLKFLEQKRSWQVEMMLAELPPTPIPATSVAPALTITTSTSPQSPPSRSPRKSPGKRKAGGRAASGKKTRVSRRSSGLGLSPTKKVIPPFETEVIPSLQIPTFTASISLLPSQPPIAAPVFVLPPPSPAASLRKHVPPEADFSLRASQPPMLQAPVFLPQSVSDSALRPHAGPSAPMAASKSAPALAPVTAEARPSTPLPHRPFPVAKPLAVRMIHAYSPAKPSPLSRILMLANSPESPDIERPRLGALDKEMEGDEEHSPTPVATIAPPVLAPPKSLAEELGMSDDSPPALREKTQANVAKRNPPGARPAAPRLSAKEKGKGKAESSKPAAASRTRAAGTLEKENVKRAKLSGGTGEGPSDGSANTEGGRSTAPAKVPPKPFSKPSGAGRLAPGKGGARRVPIGSAEAAPMGRMWKG